MCVLVCVCLCACLCCRTFACVNECVCLYVCCISVRVFVLVCASVCIWVSVSLCVCVVSVWVPLFLSVCLHVLWICLYVCVCAVYLYVPMGVCMCVEARGQQRVSSSVFKVFLSLSLWLDWLTNDGSACFYTPSVGVTDMYHAQLYMNAKSPQSSSHAGAPSTPPTQLSLSSPHAFRIPSALSNSRGEKFQPLYIRVHMCMWTHPPPLLPYTFKKYLSKATPPNPPSRPHFLAASWVANYQWN